MPDPREPDISREDDPFTGLVDEVDWRAMALRRGQTSLGAVCQGGRVTFQQRVSALLTAAHKGDSTVLYVLYEHHRSLLAESVVLIDRLTTAANELVESLTDHEGRCYCGSEAYRQAPCVPDCAAGSLRVLLTELQGDS